MATNAAPRGESHFSAARREAAACWNDLLHGVADQQAFVEAFVATQKERGLWHDDRPLCGVARPRLIAAAEMVVEEHAVVQLASAMRKVVDRVLDDAELRASHLGHFDDWAAEIIALEPRRHDKRTILRFDSFLSPAGLHFVEVNGDIPMGTQSNDALVRVVQELEIYPAFRDRYEVRPALANLGWGGALVHAWRDRGGCATPRICILSKPGGLEDQNARQDTWILKFTGFDATHAYAEDLELHDGKLYAKGRVVDVVYRALRVFDCLERRDELAPLFEAARQDAVCMVNPFHSAVISNKSLFALLTDPICAFGFTADEEQAIRAHVPWGRTMRDVRSTGPDGAEIDLLEYVAAHKDELVLKPAHEAGGAGVRLGWTCSQSEWETAVADSLGVDSVVQRRIDVAVSEYPVLEAGFPVEEFYEDTDPFLFPHGYVAVLNRISSAEITNVSRGGSIVPTFVIEPA